MTFRRINWLYKQTDRPQVIKSFQDFPWLFKQNAKLPAESSHCWKLKPTPSIKSNVHKPFVRIKYHCGDMPLLLEARVSIIVKMLLWQDHKFSAKGQAKTGCQWFKNLSNSFYFRHTNLLLSKCSQPSRFKRKPWLKFQTYEDVLLI